MKTTIYTNVTNVTFERQEGYPFVVIGMNDVYFWDLFELPKQKYALSLPLERNWFSDVMASMPRLWK